MGFLVEFSILLKSFLRVQIFLIINGQFARGVEDLNYSQFNFACLGQIFHSGVKTKTSIILKIQKKRFKSRLKNYFLPFLNGATTGICIIFSTFQFSDFKTLFSSRTSLKKIFCMIVHNRFLKNELIEILLEVKRRRNKSLIQIEIQSVSSTFFCLSHRSNNIGF